MRVRSTNRPVFSAVLLVVATALSLLAVRGNAQSTPNQAYHGPSVAEPCYQSADPDVRIRSCTEAINTDLATLVGMVADGYTTAIQRKNAISNQALVDAYFNRGNAYSEKEEYDRAIEDFTDAIRLSPGSPAAFSNRGDAYAAKKEYAQAISDYTQAINLSPFLAAAFLNRGAAYDLLDKHDLALRDYNQAIGLDPKSAIAYNNRGKSYSDADDYDRAIRDYDEAVRLDPRYVLAYSNRAEVYTRKGDNQRAIQDYRKILQIDPRNGAAKAALDSLQTAK